MTSQEIPYSSSSTRLQLVLKPGTYTSADIQLLLNESQPVPEQIIVPTEQKEDVMSDNKFVDMVKENGKSAAYRVASKQLLKGSRSLLCKTLRQQGMKKAQVRAFAEFLETDLGEAFLSAVVGFALPYVPGLKDNDKVQGIANELRVSGIATAGNHFAEGAVEQLVPMLMSSLSNLPELPLSYTRAIDADFEELKVSKKK